MALAAVAALCSPWIVAGIVLGERGLVAAFGDAYRNYRVKTWWRRRPRHRRPRAARRPAPGCHGERGERSV